MTIPTTPTCTTTAITCKPFGQLSDGRSAQLFTLTNSKGMRVSISNFGGVITSIFCVDKHGDFEDVVLGFDSVEPYEKDSPYFGALIGRFGNRIHKGRFELDGAVIQLPTNDGPNHLHGGVVGFDKVLWQVQTVQEGADQILRLTYLSKHGEQGYPGNLNVEVVYRLTENNELFTEFFATTDAPTPINLTQHSYFNLAGKGGVLSHRLKVRASYYTPVGEGLIPLGTEEPVAASVFDFLDFHGLGERIGLEDEQLKVAGGYDHNFVLDKPAAHTFSEAAVVYEPITGRCLRVKTTEPGIQLYTGNFLDGTLMGKGNTYHRHSGFCLEPQHHPDAPNQPHFPNTILRPGEKYQSKMSFEFTLI